MSQITFHASTDTIKIAASTASTNMALSVTGAQAQVMLTNGTTQFAIFKFGGSTVEASFPTTAIATPGYIVGPNGQITVTPGLATYVGASLLAGSGAVFATAGSQS